MSTYRIEYGEDTNRLIWSPEVKLWDISSTLCLFSSYSSPHILKLLSVNRTGNSWQATTEKFSDDGLEFWSFPERLPIREREVLALDLIKQVTVLFSFFASQFSGPEIRVNSFIVKDNNLLLVRGTLLGPEVRDEDLARYLEILCLILRKVDEDQRGYRSNYEASLTLRRKIFHDTDETWQAWLEQAGGLMIRIRKILDNIRLFRSFYTQIGGKPSQGANIIFSRLGKKIDIDEASYITLVENEKRVSGPNKIYDYRPYQELLIQPFRGIPSRLFGILSLTPDLLTKVTSMTSNHQQLTSDQWHLLHYACFVFYQRMIQKEIDVTSRLTELGLEKYSGNLQTYFELACRSQGFRMVV